MKKRAVGTGPVAEGCECEKTCLFGRLGEEEAREGGGGGLVSLGVGVGEESWQLLLSCESSLSTDEHICRDLLVTSLLVEGGRRSGARPPPPPFELRPPLFSLEDALGNIPLIALVLLSRPRLLKRRERSA